MSLIRHIRFRSWLALGAALAAVLALAGGAYAAFVGLPSSGQQVNDDPPTIDPAQNANLSDLTAGSLAGAGRVPWAAFAQSQKDGSAQIAVRAFKGGQWQTEGFPVSLNHDASKVATAPSIDFTGANRTVPWVSWAEPVTALGNVPNIFASRFASQPPPAHNGGQWIPESQTRTANVPSLNINTNRKADDPSLIGGTTTVGANPAPWVTWQEADNGSQTSPTGDPAKPNVSGDSRFQIFVSHAVPSTTNPTPGGPCPAATKPPLLGAGNSVGNFCFQQVGIDRAQGPSPGQIDPSLNVDPARDGIQADIAFTGPSDTVPWVVWYENSDNGKSTNGLLDADMVFAAKGVADASAPAGEDGHFHFQVVGLHTDGLGPRNLDRTSTHGFGPCAVSTATEQACSLNVGSATALTDGNGAENPQVTAGTLVPGKPTTPWVTWDESSANGGQHSVFVARLDPAGDHFDLLNGGQPISPAGFDSTRPDISFAGNTPYVSWHQRDSSGTTVSFVGHFEGNPANPTFHIDTKAIPTTPPATSDDDTTDVRSPVASTCPDDPFTADGQSCTGGAIGTPFYALTNNPTGPQQLFAQGYTPGTTNTGAASAVTQTTATVTGAVNTDGGRTLVHLDFGTTASYGSSTPGQLQQPASGVSTPFSAQLSGLPAGTLIHYRAVAQTDFGTVDGQDQTFASTGTPPPPPPATASLASGTAIVKHGVAAVKLACHGQSGERCDGRLRLSLRVRVTVGRRHHRRHRTITLGLGNTAVHIAAGQRATVDVHLDKDGRRLLAKAKHHRLRVRATITLDDHTHTSETVVLAQAPPPKHHHHHHGKGR